MTGNSNGKRRKEKEMNEEIQTKILEQVGDVTEITKQGLMKAAEIMQEQCPLLVEELLRYTAITSGIRFCFFSVASMATFFIVWQALKRKTDAGWFAPLIAAELTVLPLVGVVTSLAWLKIWIAPRLFLLEYISDLIK